METNNDVDITTEDDSFLNVLACVDESCIAQESNHTDAIHCNSEEMQVDLPLMQEYCAIVSWLRQLFESRLREKFSCLTKFCACVSCGQPINDVFDIAFVEHYHLICLFKKRFNDLEDDEIIAKIQRLKLNLFQSFKSRKLKLELINTCPQFRCFLESLKPEMAKSNYSTISTAGIKDTLNVSVEYAHNVQEIFLCPSDPQPLGRKYFKIKHDIHYPEMGSCIRPADLRVPNQHCPYCGLQFETVELMSDHQQDHERAIEFIGQQGQKTYSRLPLRSRNMKIMDAMREIKRPYSFRCYVNRKKILTRRL